MKRKKKLKMHRILIIVAVLLFLFGAMLLIKGKLNDNNPADEPVSEEPSEEPEKEPTKEPEKEPLEPGEEPAAEPTEPEKPGAPVSENPTDKNVIIVENPEAIDVLVNRNNNLPDTYVPSDLIKLTEVPTVLSNPEVNQLREPAYEALKNLFQGAKEDGFDLYARSGYRSYNTQVSLYSSYVANHGQAAADTFSAKPGQSEHQTGLSMDITCEAMNFQLDDTFGETEEGKWISENAHNYGFIIRYPKGKEDITGYMYEPWHIRYLGVELATDVYESGLTLEEYFEQ